MIVMKRWDEVNYVGHPKAQVKGWYLFGFIPLYVQRVYMAPVKKNR